MKSNQSLGILFFIRKNRASDEKMAAIYLRISVNGKRTELSIKREVEITKWNNTGSVKGTNEGAKQLNEYITVWKNKVYQAQKKLIEKGAIVNAEAIKKILLGSEEKQKTIVEVFEYHNKLLAEKIKIDHSEATLGKYKTTLDHLKNFMQTCYKSSDMLLSQLNYKFIADLEHYLLVTKNCGINTVAKYIKNVKHIVNIAVKNEWLDKDPFAAFKVTLKPGNRDFLSPDELKAIEEKEISIVRLDQVRDIFVFCCYTGLAYIDVAELTSDNLRKGIDGELWISKNRHKTETPSNIPLLPRAIQILEKYKDHPAVVNKGHLLPVLSNQKLNSYLKEIADACSITKNLTFHVARHTFATTVTLTNGVPIESVSSMLGHTSIKTTQIYAKVIQKKVSQDMKLLKEKLTVQEDLKINQA